MSVSDPVLVHRVREAIANPRVGRPTEWQALVQHARAVAAVRYDVRAPSEALLIALIAAMNAYQRCHAIARVWRRYQPDLTSVLEPTQ